jgi:putative inorganic carbon (HCO3(-)) transporter
LVAFYQGWVQLQRLRQLASEQGYWLMGAIAAQLGLLTHGLVDTVWYRPQVNTLWWLCMALIASYYVALEPREEKLSKPILDAPPA